MLLKTKENKGKIIFLFAIIIIVTELLFIILLLYFLVKNYILIATNLDLKLLIKALPKN